MLVKDPILPRSCIQSTLHARRWDDGYFYVTPIVCLGVTLLIVGWGAFTIYRWPHLRVCRTIMDRWLPLSKNQKALCIAAASVGCIYSIALFKALEVFCVGEEKKTKRPSPRAFSIPDYPGFREQCTKEPSPDPLYQHLVYFKVAQIRAYQICMQLIAQAQAEGPQILFKQDPHPPITYETQITEQENQLEALLKKIGDPEFKIDIEDMINQLELKITEASRDADPGYQLGLLEKLYQRPLDFFRRDLPLYATEREEARIKQFEDEVIEHYTTKNPLQESGKGVQRFCDWVEKRVNQELDQIKKEDPLILECVNDQRELCVQRSIIDLLRAVQKVINSTLLNPPPSDDGRQVQPDEGLWKLYAILWCRRLGFQMANWMGSIVKEETMESSRLQQEIDAIVVLDSFYDYGSHKSSYINYLYPLERNWGDQSAYLIRTYIEPVLNELQAIQRIPPLPSTEDEPEVASITSSKGKGRDSTLQRSPSDVDDDRSVEEEDGDEEVEEGEEEEDEEDAAIDEAPATVKQTPLQKALQEFTAQCKPVLEACMKEVEALDHDLEAEAKRVATLPKKEDSPFGDVIIARMANQGLYGVDSFKKQQAELLVILNGIKDTLANSLV